MQINVSLLALHAVSFPAMLSIIGANNRRISASSGFERSNIFGCSNDLVQATLLHVEHGH